MREIKFCTWNKITKKFGNILAIDFDNQIVYTESEGNFGYWKLEEVELMQFTGLHDKNGKEIYEGDIVKSKETFGEYPENFFDAMEVVFEYGKFCVKGEYFGYEGEGLISLESCEVIGNIHENPELLEEK